ncbi:MAG: hypothetical protein JRH16_03570 [Deltaproteobacteria bacterium]|nr:hypothetical protein [Deltaproteobacteria bacterium]MBW2360246.1 hypothetical protein [Deltaproteobacteria bacterium]
MQKLACILACLVLAASAAHADSPAAIPDSSHDRAGAAFDAFAAKWMDRARDTEEQSRANPSVKPGASAPLVTYRGYGDDYSLELRPTGNPSAPYVGLLRYTEHLYGCSSIEATTCTIVSSVPITEIFRYQGGRWRY